MNPTPNGDVTRRDDGTFDLTLKRRFHTGIDDVWASITEPERTARWYGPWRGEPGAGRDIEFQMAFEEGGPWKPAHIEACDPPRYLAVTSVDKYGSWHLSATLSESDGWTELTFVQERIAPDMIEHVGPGWEYYLDNLVASRDGSPLPDFDDYYPSQQGYYQERARHAGG